MDARQVDNTGIDFHPLVETVNTDEYGASDLPRAFVHWSMRLVLADQELGSTTLKEQTLIGGKGDCGVDGWFLEDDQDPPMLHLFQGKYGEGSLVESDIEELWNAPLNLLNPGREKNEEAASLARQLIEWIKNNISIQMHYASTCPLAPSAKARVHLLEQQKDISLGIEGQNVRFPVEFHFWDSDKLTETYRERLRGGMEPPQKYHLDFVASARAPKYVQVELPGGTTRTILFLCKAIEIARIFAGPPKRWELFRENPRGPLQRYHPQIWATLNDPAKRAKFHTLNNGLSIVCEHYEIDYGGTGVTVEGLRIVNGCQTTVTLGRALDQHILDEQTLITVRLTETTDPDYRKDISEANNTQKQVSSAQLASLEDELRNYQNLFQALRPEPYYFEIQTGAWDYMLNRDEKKRYGNRHIEKETLAQANLSFMGEPSEAMEYRRFIFRRTTGSSGDSRGSFDKIFGAKHSAEELLLPWLILKKVEAALQRAEANPGNALTNPEFTRYSLLHRTWLVAELLQLYSIRRFSTPKLDQRKARMLCEHTDRWFDDLYTLADEAVFEAMESIKARMGEEFEARRIFRASHHTLERVDVFPNKVFKEKLQRLLSTKERRGEDVFRGLNEVFLTGA